MSASTTANKLDDGSVRIVADRDCGEWHRPKVTTTPLQWLPETGMTRYEWARQHTPERQVEFFEGLKRLYEDSPPIIPNEDDYNLFSEINLADLDPESLDDEQKERLSRLCLFDWSPDGKWGFRVQGMKGNHLLPDYDLLGVWCRDSVTMPDWEFVLRFRSWVLPDDREAFLWMPGQNEECLGRYMNDSPAAVFITSPRYVE